MSSTSTDSSDTELMHSPMMKRKRMTKPNSDDKSSVIYQKRAWKDLKNYFAHSLKCLTSNNVVKIKNKLLKRNIVRGKGLFCSVIMKAQLFSTEHTNLYAILVSLINLEFPNVAELLLTRCIWWLKAAHIKNIPCAFYIRGLFVSRLIYHGVADASLAIDVANLSLRFPATNDYIKTGVRIMYENGKKLNALESRQTDIDKIYYRLQTFSDEFRFLDEITGKWVAILMEAKANNFQQGNQTTTSIVTNQVAHNFCFDDIGDSCDSFDEFQVDLDYIANENLYKLQLHNSKRILTLSNDHNDGDDGDDEGEKTVDEFDGINFDVRMHD